MVFKFVLLYYEKLSKGLSLDKEKSLDCRYSSLTVMLECYAASVWTGISVLGQPHHFGAPVLILPTVILYIPDHPVLALSPASYFPNVILLCGQCFTNTDVFFETSWRHRLGVWRHGKLTGVTLFSHSIGPGLNPIQIKEFDTKKIRNLYYWNWDEITKLRCFYIHLNIFLCWIVFYIHFILIC